MVYSLPYIAVVLLYAMLAWIYRTAKEEDRTKIRIVCVLFYVFFFGFRGYVGDDWTIYYPVFEEYIHTDGLGNMLFSFEDSSFEPGFTFLMLFCKLIINDYVFLVLVTTLINVGLLYRFLRRNVDNVPLGFMLFLCMGGLVMQINLLRNTISILLFVNAIEFIVKRKPWPFFLLCILGMFFHLSTIIYIPLYFVFHKRAPRWLYLTIFIAGNLLFLAQVKFITPIMSYVAGHMGEEYQLLVEAYTEGKISELNNGISIGYLERLFTGVLIYCYYDKLVKLRPENAVYINSYLAYFFMFFFFSEFTVVATRLSYLFTYFYWVIWIDLLKCFSVRSNKMFFVFYLAVYSVLKIWGQTNLITLRYDNMLLGGQSYEERLYIHEKNKEEI